MLKDLSNIENQLTTQGLFNAFKAQLTKDFQQSNFPTDFITTLEPDYKSIHRKIVHELQRSEMTKDSKLMALVNRIDISEAQLKKYLREQKGTDSSDVIAELIIKRVLQKVVIRQFYRNIEE